MATIHKEFFVNASPEFVWDAIKAVGEVHTRLARGFVTRCEIKDGARTVTFANGFVVQEKIIAIDDALQRMAYTAVGGRALHHNASFQVFAAPNNQCRILWVTDLLPDEMHAPIAQMVELGSSAIKQTLEKAFVQKQ
jgi:hypothetical protein